MSGAAHATACVWDAGERDVLGGWQPRTGDGAEHETEDGGRAEGTALGEGVEGMSGQGRKQKRAACEKQARKKYGRKSSSQRRHK